MKEKISNLSFKTLLLSSFFVIALTQSMSFQKIFGFGFYSNDGSLSEFLMNIGSILMSIMSFALIVYLAFIGFKSESKLNMRDKVGIFSLHALGVGILIAVYYSIVGGDLLKIVFDVNTNTENIYNIIFNKKLYMIDIALIVAIYVLRHKTKISDYLLQALACKTAFTFGVYLVILSIVNSYGIDKSPNAYISTNIFCQGTYVQTTNIFFVKNVDCPFEGSKSIDVDLAKSGSTMSYRKVIKSPISIQDKAATALAFYESNARLGTDIWLEKTLPSIYQESYLALSKKYYTDHKEADLLVAKMILNGDLQGAKVKAESLILEQGKNPEYSFLHAVRDSKI